MLTAGLLIAVVGAAMLLYGVFLIVEGILFYAFAEKKDAVVTERHEVIGIDGNSWYKNTGYAISAVLDDCGEKRVIRCIDRFRLYVDNKMNMDIGDKIVVRYLKKFGICACDRGKPLKYGLCIVFILVISAIIILSDY